jgi:hypothetical protein
MTRESSTDDPRLDAQLATLPRELAPARDLWPAISAALVPEPAARVRWPLGLAAGIAAAAFAAFVGWRAGRETAVPTAAVEPAAQRSADRLQTSFEAPADPEFLAARAALERSYHERLASLAPPTRARIEQNLEIIREANADIRRALAADPQSPVLQRLLESTWQQEIDLYATVSRSIDPAALRSRT